MEVVGYTQNYLSLRKALLLVGVAAVAFHVAYGYPSCGFFVAVYLWCLFQLSRVATSRQAFYLGLGVGFLVFAPQMTFLWTLFGPAAIALWCIMAFWLALFLLLGRLSRQHFGPVWGIVLLPFLWTGLEYFRSELYYLRFTWLNAGYAFSQNLSWLPLKYIGVYGIGFLIMAGVCLCSLAPRRSRIFLTFAALIYLGVLTNLVPPRLLADRAMPDDLRIAGMQMEFPSELEVLVGLDKLAKQYPQAQLLVLSEYTFDGPVPDKVKTWCRKNNRYLIAGGKDPADSSKYFNTAFVIGPDGTIVFKQAKSVPIQFFKDGLPAKEQKLWASPWGKLGLCICYDLSYTRVTDELVRQGAQAIIVPTMDVVDWGRHQHELHGRIAPVRAAEYGVPIFRLASSGFSQCVNSAGRVVETAPMPGDGAMLSATLRLPNKGTVPPDRIVAPVAVGVTAAAIGWFVFSCVRARKSPLENPNRL
jgi:apolipoprotein N-acyltransferase